MYDANFWIEWICADYTPFDFSGKSYFITTPSRESRFLAEKIYLQTYTQALDDGILSDDETNTLLIKHGIWFPADEDLLLRMTGDLDEVKVQMFNSYTNSTKMNQLRIALRENKKYISGLLSRKYSFNQLGAKAVAQLARQHYLLGKSIFRKKNRPLYSKGDWWTDHSDDILNKAYQTLNDYSLEEEDYREIARSPQWRNIWSSRKGSNLFGRAAVDLSLQQRQLLMWSNMYDNVYKHSECPPDCVVEDDDLCDGWLITQKRKRDSEINKSTIEGGLSPKIASAEEVYILCSEDKIKDVYEMNDISGKVAWNRRMKQIQRQGICKDVDLIDMQERIRNV